MSNVRDRIIDVLADVQTMERERAESIAYAVLALEAMRKAHDHLMNLQPHIPVACYPGHEGFIDSHVNEAMRVLDAALAKNPDPSVSRTGEAPGALSGSGERDRPICAKCGMPYAASAQYTRCPGCDAPLEEKNAQSSDWVCICPVDGKACPDSGLCMNVGPCTSAVEAARIRAYVKEARDESEGGNS